MVKKSNKGLFKSFDAVNIGSDFLGGDFSDGLGQFKNPNESKLFLRRFEPEDLLAIMKKVGLIAHLEGLGFEKLFVTTDVDDTLVNYMKLYTERESPDYLLFDLRVSESKFLPNKQFFDDPDEIVTYDMIVIEWLSAQNPFMNFPKDGAKRPQLPGQKKPGLGVLNYCFKMMYLVAREVIKDGFLDVPDHMHGAIMYSRRFKFFNPAHEAILQAIKRDLKKYSLADISWGMLTGTIIDEEKGTPQVYDPSEQIFYVSNRMRDYFHSKKYRETFKHYFKKKRYRFDYDLMLRKREEILRKKPIIDL